MSGAVPPSPSSARARPASPARSSSAGAASRRPAWTAACMLDSIYHFPEEMRWFSTRDLLDIAGVPFTSPEPHPTRLETLAYYRGVAERFGVQVRRRDDRRAASRRAGRRRDGVRERQPRPERLEAPAAILATGFFHNPQAARRAGRGSGARARALRVRVIRFTAATSSSWAARTRRPRRRSTSTATARASRSSCARRRSRSGSSTGSSPTWRTASPPERSGRSSVVVLEITPDWVRVATPDGEQRIRGRRGLSADRLRAGLRPLRALRHPARGREPRPGPRPGDARVERPEPLPGGRHAGRPGDRADLHREQPAPRGHDRLGDRRPAARRRSASRRLPGLQPLAAPAVFQGTAEGMMSHECVPESGRTHGPGGRGGSGW